MLATIKLDDQANFKAGKIRKIRTYRSLAPEFQVIQLPVAQSGPKQCFSICLSFAKRAGAHPHPRPLPRTGEGV